MSSPCHGILGSNGKRQNYTPRCHGNCAGTLGPSLRRQQSEAERREEEKEERERERETEREHQSTRLNHWQHSFFKTLHIKSRLGEWRSHRHQKRNTPFSGFHFSAFFIVQHRKSFESAILRLFIFHSSLLRTIRLKINTCG